MRVQTDARLLDVVPGGEATVSLDVVNTSPVIDGITARVIGLDSDHVTSTPPLLSLFPDASGRVTVTIELPETFPAGRHPLTVELASSTGLVDPEHVDLDLVVATTAKMALQPRPAKVRARRRGQFRIECTNEGNVPLEVALSAVDDERSLHYAFSPDTLHVPPGATSSTTLTVRGPRMLFGGELDRPFTVRADAGPLAPDATTDVPATLRQRPLIPRGALTVLVLASIVGLWALAFLLGLTKVFSSDPLTKAAPASFFAATSGGEAGEAGAPGDVLSKDGALPPGVGGTVSGRVVAVSNGEGVGRIVVEALRPTKHGLRLVSSAATQTDGSYQLVGLFPASYLLRFSAPGYTPVWYPAAPTDAGATPVAVSAQAVAEGKDVRIVGLPASISGKVDLGDTLDPIPTTVVVRSVGGSASDPESSIKKTTTTDGDGGYLITGLPAPNTYELTFTAPGYEPATVVQKVGGGQDRAEATVRLSAGGGLIGGTVVSGSTPLGGVTVTTTVDGREVTTATPTMGDVGRFTLSDLPTPGTYVVTFAKESYGAQTVVVALGPGEQNTTLAVDLVGGTGTVSGRLVGPDDRGLGGATVTIGGLPHPASTTTLTTGEVGAFLFAGLPTPGSYTFTFSLPGYMTHTVPVTLDAQHPAPTVQVKLAAGLGSIRGRVLNTGGQGNVGATITVTDGKDIRTTVSTSNSDPAKSGAYVFADLPPGAYSVTVSREGYGPQTALVFVVAGQVAEQNLTLQSAGGTP